MRFYAFVLLAAPLACLAQVPAAPPAVQTPAGPKAPPEVDQALRARVNAFLDYESNGNNRKAYDLVAEDSKDYYFEAKKARSTSFTIDEIQYEADLSRATVKSTMKRQMIVAGHPVEMPQVQSSQWKLEKGEWVWYHDPSKDVIKTIFGEQPAPPAEAAPGSPVPPPPNLSPEAIRQLAGRISPKAAIDKKLVRFILGKEATEQINFHNNNPGFVRVYAEVRGVADTITVEPGDVMAKPEADVPFKIIYKPRPESSMQGEVRFTLEPFGTVYTLPVSLASKGQTPAPAVP